MTGDPPPGLRSVVIDCPDPSSLARFYAELLGGRAVTTDPDWCEVLFERPPKLAFQLASDYRPPEWPDGLPQQLHLDLTVSDLGTVSSRAVALGARVLGEPVRENGSVFMVHADPAGHPFCLCQDLQ
jgi:predicted enzyme related to lactoylglutathione lyase